MGLAGDHIVVRDDDEGMSIFLVQLANQVKQDLAVLAVEITGGLVGHNQLGAVHQRPGDGHPLLLAAGKLVGFVLQAVGQSHVGEQLAGVVRIILPMIALDHARDQHILQSGEFCQKMMELENKADIIVAEAGQLRFAVAEHILTIDVQLPRRRCIDGAENIQQSALAYPRGAHNHGDLRLENIQVHPPEHLHLIGAGVVGFTDVAGF